MRRLLLAIAAAAAFCAPAYAADTPKPEASPRPLFEWGSFATTQTLKTAAGKRQIFGAKLAGSLALPFGARAIARIDFTGLQDGQAVDPTDPSTFQAVDLYGGVHGPDLLITCSVAAGGGIAFDIEGGALKTVEHNPLTYGAGVRCGFGSFLPHSTVYSLLGRHDAAGPGLKSITAAQIFLTDRVSLVLDVVAPNGYQRLGVAYRIK